MTTCLLLVIGLLGLGIAYQTINRTGNWPPGFLRAHPTVAITGPGVNQQIEGYVLGAVLRPGMPTFQLGGQQVPTGVESGVPEWEAVYLARSIERLPLGTPYPAVARRLIELLANLRRREMAHLETYAEAQQIMTLPFHVTGRPPLAPLMPKHTLLIDATGVGAPVVDLLRDGLKTEPLARDTQLRPITFTHGERLIGDRMGKAYLVSRLQTLLQRQCIQLPRTQEAEDTARELETYEIHVDATTAHDTYGAFKVGAHDDLATALGLATLLDPVRQVAGYGARLYPF